MSYLRSFLFLEREGIPEGKARTRGMITAGWQTKKKHNRFQVHTVHTVTNKTHTQAADGHVKLNYRKTHTNNSETTAWTKNKKAINSRGGDTENKVKPRQAKKSNQIPNRPTHRAVRLGAKDLRRHVTGGAALRRHEAVHDAAREAEVGQLHVRVVVLGGEQQVLGLEVAVHDAEVVAVPHGVQEDAAQVPSLLLVVVRLLSSLTLVVGVMCRRVRTRKKLAAKQNKHRMRGPPQQKVRPLRF